jgi:hypothetical protein
MAAAVEAVEVTAVAVAPVVAVTVPAAMEERVAIMVLQAMTVTVMEVRGAAKLTMVV